MIASAQLIVDRHGGCVPGTKEDLVKLPGIGPKMAYLVLSVAFNKNEGICVDVRRSCARCSGSCCSPPRVSRVMWTRACYFTVFLHTSNGISTFTISRFESY